jgi:hypothetical protein
MYHVTSVHSFSTRAALVPKQAVWLTALTAAKTKHGGNVVYDLRVLFLGYVPLMQSLRLLYLHCRLYLEGMSRGFVCNSQFASCG